MSFGLHVIASAFGGLIALGLVGFARFLFGRGRGFRPGYSLRLVRGGAEQEVLDG